MMLIYKMSMTSVICKGSLASKLTSGSNNGSAMGTMCPQVSKVGKKCLKNNDITLVRNIFMPFIIAGTTTGIEGVVVQSCNPLTAARTVRYTRFDTW